MTGVAPIGLEQAIAAVLAQVRPLAAERVPLRESLGRRLAEDVAAAEPVPASDNSAMDGFAVRAADTRGARPEGPALLRLAGESRAGHPAAASLAPGEAIRISTGAEIPGGADAVIRVEDTFERDGGVLVRAEVAVGANVRRAGEDVTPGTTVLRSGTRIGPAEIGVLAALGIAEPRCRLRPGVAVLTSGDELLEPGQAMRPGGVRDSNAYSVTALALSVGAAASNAPALPDDPEATRAAIAAALDNDVVVLCGGVSVGRHDHVKQALAELGVEQAFWRIALKPGKPVWFGTLGDTLVFGLPGNPVSAMVTFLLLVRPALTALGGGDPRASRTTATLAADIEEVRGRTHAARCRLELREDGWHAHPAPRQGSHVLTSMLGADCLALLPPEHGPPRAGDRVEVELVHLGWLG